MKLPIEDEFNDVLGKAQKGLGIETDALAKAAGVADSAPRNLRRGDFDEEAARAVAKALSLNADALVSLGKGEWYPEVPEIGGLKLVPTPFSDLHVNAFVVWDPASKRAAAFDTGTDGTPLIDFIEKQGLSLETLFLTHTHHDHVQGVDAVAKRFGCPVVVNERESDKPSGAKQIREGYEAKLGALSIKAIETTGHTAGGTTFLIGGLERPLAIVGDALFSGSMGGANTSYDDCLAGLKRLLQLDPETVLAPGHGPMTTVAQEREHNCFWTGEK